MALFTPSTIPWVSAVQQIADSAGASADTEMLNRASLSLRASFQYFNSKARWNFLRTEAAPIAVVAPFVVTGITASGGTAILSAVAGHGLEPDDIFVGNGILVGDRVSTTAATSFTTNATVTGFTGTATADYTSVRDSYSLPSNWRATYSVRMLGSQKALRYVGRRLYDRNVNTEFASGTVLGYDLFNSFGRGKIRLIPPPSGAEVLLHRYLRGMALASASAATAALDIPEDYESYVIAWAKWHFLTDKGEGRKEQATTWVNLAAEGLKTMLTENNAIPDEDLAFMPGYASFDPYGGDNSTRYINWDY